MKKQLKRKCIVYGLGIIVYAGAVWGAARFMLSDQEKFAIFLGTYLLIGYGAFQKLSEEIMEKRFPVEYILVIFATIGAFGIGKYMEAVIVMLMFELGMLAEQIATDRTKRSIAKMIDLRPTYAIRKVKGQEVQVDPSELKMSHIIVIKPGERIPVDAVVLAGSSTIDTKAITGEAMPVEVYKGDKIYSGCINLNAVIEAKVLAVYQDSTVSRIMEMVERAQDEKAESENFITRFSKIYTPIMLILALLVMIYPPLTFSYGNWDTWIYRGLIFLVVACPSGMMISVPIAFLGGIASAACHGIVVKGGNYLEDLTKADTFIFDKTGTLTEGVFHVKEIKAVGMSNEELLRIAAHVESYSNHPIAQSLKDAYDGEISQVKVGRMREIPGYGISATFEGQKVYMGSKRLMEKRRIVCDTVSKPGTVVYVALGDKYAGYIVIADTIKEKARTTLRYLKEKREAVLVMMTGDTEKASLPVAKELKMDYAYTDLMPTDKMEQLEEFMELQDGMERVVCVGDGINDAPVLARADVGIAMGAMGSAAAVEAADIILMDDELPRIKDAIKIAKETLRVVTQNITFALVIKAVILVLAAIGYFSMWEAIIAEVGVMFAGILNAVWVVRYRV